VVLLVLQDLQIERELLTRKLRMKLLNRLKGNIQDSNNMREEVFNKIDKESQWVVQNKVGLMLSIWAEFDKAIII
jgi:hypothetical protein